MSHRTGATAPWFSLQVEPFGFPDVAICPTSGAGCDSEDPLVCLAGMKLFVYDLAVSRLLYHECLPHHVMYLYED